MSGTRRRRATSASAPVADAVLRPSGRCSLIVETGTGDPFILHWDDHAITMHVVRAVLDATPDAAFTVDVLAPGDKRRCKALLAARHAVAGPNGEAADS